MENTTRHAHWVEMSNIFKGDEISSTGRYEISKRVFEPDFWMSMNPEYEGQEIGDVITILYDTVKKETVMSDSIMEKRTNTSFVVNATGDVLIAGLGLGMIILAIQGRPDIKTITIIERDKELAEMVLSSLQKHLLSKVKIVYSDINEYVTNDKFDTIYFDIWNNVGDDGDFEEMLLLMANFKKNLRKEISNNMSCWRYFDARMIAMESEFDYSVSAI